jgi:hypothetical protein
VNIRAVSGFLQGRREVQADTGISTNVADWIDAATKQGEKEDDKLRELSSDDAKDILNSVRQLVC